MARFSGVGWGGKLLNTQCVFWFSLQCLFVTFLLLTRNKPDISKNVRPSSYKAPFYSCPIVMKLAFSRQIFEKPLKYQISWKSAHWEPSCSMRTDGQRTDMTNLFAILRTRLKNQQSTLYTASHPSYSLIGLVHISAQFCHCHSSLRYYYWTLHDNGRAGPKYVGRGLKTIKGVSLQTE